MAEALIFPSTVRTCTRCRQEKPLDAFSKSTRVKRDGRASRCRECEKIRMDEYRSRLGVKEREAEYHAQRYEEPEYRQRQRENQGKPQRRVQKAKYSAKYRGKNKDQIREYMAEYIQRPHVIELRREANQRHNEKRETRPSTEHSRAINREWCQIRRQIPKWNLHHRMSARVRFSLKNSKNGSSWESLVGYTVNDLKKHLEKKFKPGMSWKNMNEWHIDHIIPVAAFNFEKPLDQEFMDCWALNNLQPLWALENIAKGNKIPMNLGGRVSA